MEVYASVRSERIPQWNKFSGWEIMGVFTNKNNSVNAILNDISFDNEQNKNEIDFFYVAQSLYDHDSFLLKKEQTMAGENVVIEKAYKVMEFTLNESAGSGLNNE